MMSTTGRRPVIAAPTATPVNPASEIGVSMTRDFPNSSTSPDKTLNGVPASATSSPIRHTRGSRRISSASASRTASPSVNSRTATSGINVLLDLIQAGVSCLRGKLDGSIDFGFGLRLNPVKLSFVGEFLADDPLGKQFDWIALGHPTLLLLFGAIIFAIYVSDVMAAIPVRIAQQKCRPFPRTHPIHEAACDRVHAPDILPIHTLRGNSECPRSRQNIARRRFRKMRVFVVHIIFANVDERKIPESRQIHYFVQEALAKRPFAEKTDGDLLRAEGFCGERRSRGDTYASSYDRIRSKVAALRVGNVHRTTFALAVARFLAQQFGKHPVRRRAFRQAMPVAAVRARNVI